MFELPAVLPASDVVCDRVLKVVFTTTIRSAAQRRLLRLNWILRTLYNLPASHLRRSPVFGSDSKHSVVTVSQE